MTSSQKSQINHKITDKTQSNASDINKIKNELIKFTNLDIEAHKSTQSFSKVLVVKQRRNYQSCNEKSLEVSLSANNDENNFALHLREELEHTFTGLSFHYLKRNQTSISDKHTNQYNNFEGAAEPRKLQPFQLNQSTAMKSLDNKCGIDLKQLKGYYLFDKRNSVESDDLSESDTSSVSCGSSDDEPSLVLGDKIIYTNKVYTDKTTSHDNSLSSLDLSDLKRKNSQQSEEYEETNYSQSNSPQSNSQPKNSYKENLEEQELKLGVDPSIFDLPSFQQLPKRRINQSIDIQKLGF